MAVSKANRSISAAQPERRRPDLEPVELLPIKVHVYRNIGELNAGFEKVLQDLKALGNVNFFRSSSITSMHRAVARIRAQTNRELTLILHRRELANADYFDRFRAEADAEDSPAKRS